VIPASFDPGLILVTIREDEKKMVIKTNKRHLLRWGIAGVVAVAVMAIAVAIASVSGLAWAAQGKASSSYWQIGYYTPSGRALSMAAAPAASNAVASLNFTNQDNTALLVTKNKAQFPGLLGDLTGKSVSASFTISGVTSGQGFTYYNTPPCGSTPASVRYFFETSYSAGGFNETYYWWSNPVAVVLNSGPYTLQTVPLTGANWSDYYGHFGNDPAYAAQFNSAVSNVTMIGLSFGGGCFFENGVGTTDGSGTFTLNSYTAS
jgi:hypothetical protein